MFQTRSETTGLCIYKTLSAAKEAADTDKTIWKISFGVGKESVRLVRNENNEWVWEPIDSPRNLAA